MVEQIDLARAVEVGVVTREQADALRRLSKGAADPEPQRTAPRLAEAILAAAFAVALSAGPLAGWSRFGGPGLFATAAAYSLILFAAGSDLWSRKRGLAGGLLVAAAALMVPFALHGLGRWIGLFPENPAIPQDLGALLRRPSFAVDVAATAALAVAMWRFPFPPLAAILTGAAWFLAMDAAPLVFGGATTWSQRALLSAELGLCAIAAGFLLDRRTRGDFAGWLYAAGLVALCGGITTFQTASDATVLLHAGLDAALVLVALLLRRRIFAVFGALGLAGAAGHLVDDLFDGPILIVTSLGIALVTIAAAVAYCRLEQRLSEPLRARVPVVLRRLLPPVPRSSP